MAVEISDTDYRGVCGGGGSGYSDRGNSCGPISAERQGQP